MSRPTFEEIYMKLALSLEKRSTCERKQVGCVITSEDYSHVFGIGYNGNAPGEHNGCERPNEPGNCGCEHAESNALLKVAESELIPKVVFVTWSPCVSCAKKMLIKKGISQVYYLRDYRDNPGIKLLEKHGIYTKQIKEEDL